MSEPKKKNIDEEFPTFALNFDFNCNENYIANWSKEPECSDAELLACLEVVEKTEAEKASRFAILNSDELQEIVSNAEAKGSKRNTKWFVKMFEGKYKYNNKQCQLINFIIAIIMTTMCRSWVSETQLRDTLLPITGLSSSRRIQFLAGATRCWNLN